MKPTLKSLLTESQSTLIMLPKTPYFDQVAAATALYLALKKEKETTMHAPTSMIVEFNRLVAVDKITTEIGSRNLIIKLINTQYPASNVERVLYDTDGVSDLALTVVPKTGVPAPKAEHFIFDASGTSADTVILIGGAHESHFPTLSHKDLAAVRLIHLGREELSLPGREILSLARPASTLSEVVAQVLQESEIEVDNDIATNLLMGITEGSRNFVGADVTSVTFRIVADLLDRGGVRKPATPPMDQKTETQPSQPAPKSWLEPKIYKGTSVS